VKSGVWSFGILRFVFYALQYISDLKFLAVIFFKIPAFFFKTLQISSFFAFFIQFFADFLGVNFA